VRFTGIDREAAFIAHCRARYPGCTFLEGDFGALRPQLPREADAVLALAVLEHLPRPETLFQAASDLLKPGGRLYVSTPAPAAGRWHALGARMGLLSSWAREEHQALLHPARIRALAGAAGLAPFREERFLLGLNQFFIFIKPGGEPTDPPGRA
jgi:trans-aconitate methyltransferase